MSDLTFTYVFFFSSRRRHTRLVSDWSSDVCSSDLPGAYKILAVDHPEQLEYSNPDVLRKYLSKARDTTLSADQEIGRASCRERVEISVVAGAVKQHIKKKKDTDRRTVMHTRTTDDA